MGVQTMSFVKFENVYKRYIMGEITINAADGVSFEIEKGEFAVIVGASGAGKTTILNMLGGMDTCDEGKILVDGKDIATFNKKQLTTYRRYDIGFVFQFYNLVQNMTAYDNIEVSSELVKNAMDTDEVLKMVGLYDRKDNFPSQLSGGEQQRVSIARALAKKPKLLLCDEPTGALDYETGKMILGLLKDISKKENQTTIIITHNAALKAMADHVMHVKNGTIIAEEYNSSPTPISEIEW